MKAVGIRGDMVRILVSDGDGAAGVLGSKGRGKATHRSD